MITTRLRVVASIQTRTKYSDVVINHYERSRNVGSLNKNL